MGRPRRLHFFRDVALGGAGLEVPDKRVYLDVTSG